MMNELPKLPERKVDTHKNECGRVLIIAGAGGMSGAGALASRAAGRSGAGIVTWAIPEGLLSVCATICPEIIKLPVPQTQQLAPSMAAREHLLEAAHEADSVVLGPGLPVAGETGELMRLLIPEIRAKLVLDAGALRAIGTDTSCLSRRKNFTVVTPHLGEMAGLTGSTIPEIEASGSEIASQYAKNTRATVVLKGASSVVTDGTNQYVNKSGNQGMATAGSGDVLCGVLATLLAQPMPSLDAVTLGVYLHGVAGDIAKESKGVYGLIASDIIESLPKAIIEHGA